MKVGKGLRHLQHPALADGHARIMPLHKVLYGTVGQVFHDDSKTVIRPKSSETQKLHDALTSAGSLQFLDNQWPERMQDVVTG